jgi:hypothetical protein
MTGHQVRSYGPNVTTDDSTTQPPSGPSAAGHGCTSQYEIRVQGRLGRRWDAWFDGLDLTTEDDGTTVIRGPVVDQAALHGVLQKLRDLGIPLVSLEAISQGSPNDDTDLTDDPNRNDPPGATS